MIRIDGHMEGKDSRYQEVHHVVATPSVETLSRPERPCEDTYSVVPVVGMPILFTVVHDFPVLYHGS